MSCSMVFLIIVINMATGINLGAPDWNIFQNGFRTIPKMLNWFVLELFLNKPFSRIVLKSF